MDRETEKLYRMIPCTLDLLYKVQDESIRFLTSAPERGFALKDITILI